jgi:hypothetical protein
MWISRATSPSRLLWNSFARGQETDQSNIDVYFTFTLSVRITNLWVAPYSQYQQFLYDTISDFRQKGWNYTQIADWFNSNDYKTARGKKFQGSHAHSIVKKKRIRESRLTRKYPPKLSNFALRFVDRTLINQ